MPLRRLRHGEIPIDGRATDLDTPRDGGYPQLLGTQPMNLVVALDPAGVARLTEHRRRGRELCRLMEGSAEGMKVPSIAEKEPLQGLAQVPHQVEPVDDLDRLGRPLPKAFNFRCPTETLPSIHANGIEVANLANNHSGDFGPEALVDGRARLIEAGIAPVTLAVAWTLAHDFVGSTIIGATRVEQLDESLAAADLQLSPEVLAALDAVSREILYPMG